MSGIWGRAIYIQLYVAIYTSVLLKLGIVQLWLLELYVLATFKVISEVQLWLLELYVLATSKVISERYQLVTGCAHGDFIVLPHGETRHSCSR